MTTKETTQVKAGRYVDTEFVDTVRAEYKKERWMQNSERLGKLDSLSVWWDTTTLQEFLNACKENGADGVRYYFMTYPQDFTEVPEYAGRQSIVMVATRSKVDANGNLIGLCFDGNYEALSHKIAFDKDLNRTICVDVRYVLWCIDKLGGASNIIKELKLVKM